MGGERQSSAAQSLGARWSFLYTPGMGVNLWGDPPSGVLWGLGEKNPRLPDWAFVINEPMRFERLQD
jgi:hypothetical protein